MPNRLIAVLAQIADRKAAKVEPWGCPCALLYAQRQIY